MPIDTTASKPCDMPGCSSYAIGGGRWCPKHHAESETTGGISRAMALEIADNWEQMAGTEPHTSPARRETLRECADLIRMISEPKAILDCPHAGPFRYCQRCVVNPCPLGLKHP